MLGLFAANYSLDVFLSLCENSTSGSFLGKCAGLVCCKTGGGACTGGGAGCFRFVGGARTIILSIIPRPKALELWDTITMHRYQMHMF